MERADSRIDGHALRALQLPHLPFPCGGSQFSPPRNAFRVRQLFRHRRNPKLTEARLKKMRVLTTYGSRSRGIGDRGRAR